MSSADLSAIVTSVKLAVVTIVILMIIGMPLAWMLARSHWRYKFFIESFIALPLVLPPTVLGFYLLLWMGPNGFIGQCIQALGMTSFVFSFSGLVVGSVLYSLPFVVKPLQDSFSAIDNSLIDAATTLGAPPLRLFIDIVLPLSKKGVLTSIVLGFAHTIGEFGVVLMIGGNIPNKTRVVSIAIYDHVEAMQYSSAHALSFVLVVSSFVFLAIVYGVNTRRKDEH